ncbi:ABC transporter substrate-binding protein [Psychromonas sp. KJ10-2]|uniref:ABC transporter substrate-binding protein n=1 Tax=Psychromonas sp. KJ10-2 TaxID=3391822 RepID=UPI0039B39162
MKHSKRTFITGLTLTILGLTTFSNTICAAETLTAGKLSIGMEMTYPPFESYEGDKVVGFDPDMAVLLGKQIGAEVNYVETKFSGLMLGLNANKYDIVISGIYVTPERQKKAYVIPYARTGAAIMVGKGSKYQPRTEKDLCGMTVGLQQGTTWVTALNKLSDSYCKEQGKGEIRVRAFPSAPEVSQALMSKNIEAQVEISGAAKIIVKKSKGRIEISSEDLIYPQTLGIYVNKNNPALKDSLQQAFDTINSNGSFPDLLEKYELNSVTQ